MRTPDPETEYVSQETMDMTMTIQTEDIQTASEEVLPDYYRFEYFDTVPAGWALMVQNSSPIPEAAIRGDIQKLAEKLWQRLQSHDASLSSVRSEPFTDLRLLEEYIGCDEVMIPRVSEDLASAEAELWVERKNGRLGRFTVYLKYDGGLGLSVICMTDQWPGTGGEHKLNLGDGSHPDAEPDWEVVRTEDGRTAVLCRSDMTDGDRPYNRTMLVYRGDSALYILSKNSEPSEREAVREELLTAFGTAFESKG